MLDNNDVNIFNAEVKFYHILDERYNPNAGFLKTRWDIRYYPLETLSFVPSSSGPDEKETLRTVVCHACQSYVNLKIYETSYLACTPQSISINNHLLNKLCSYILMRRFGEAIGGALILFAVLFPVLILWGKQSITTAILLCTVFAVLSIPFQAGIAIYFLRRKIRLRGVILKIVKPSSLAEVIQMPNINLYRCVTQIWVTEDDKHRVSCTNEGPFSAGRGRNLSPTEPEFFGLPKAYFSIL